MKFFPQKWKAAYDAGRGRPSDSRAVVPYSNNNNQVVLPPPNNGRRLHRIRAASARVEVVTTPQGKQSNWYFDHGFEMWWEE